MLPLPPASLHDVSIGCYGSSRRLWLLPSWLPLPRRQHNTTCPPLPLHLLPLPQRAVAYGLDSEQPFYCGLGGVLQQKRQLLERQLAAIGFRVLPADGTYFLVADFAGLLPEGSTEDDVEVGVQAAERLVGAGWCKRLPALHPLPVSKCLEPACLSNQTCSALPRSSATA